jgi:glycosyltransferase involved in cell wall biosynthesis
MLRHVRCLILLPFDPAGAKIGGIKSFVNDMLRVAPDDFEMEVVGCSEDPVQRPVGRWGDLEVGDRRVPFLPVLAIRDAHRRPRIPLSLTFTLAAVASRSAHRFGGRILQFHHPGVPSGFVMQRSPKVIVAHLNPADIDRGAGESRFARLPGLLHRLEDVTLRQMDRIFVVNQAGLAFYRERHPSVADRVTFMPTWVDQAIFRPQTGAARLAARVALLKSLGLPFDAPDGLALFVGRLELQKDPMLLVESFAAATQTEHSIRLVVVGEGGLREAAERHAVELGVAARCHWLGARPRAEMPSLMNGSDALILPSRFEGMPITVLEALACGLPVVATAVGEIPLVVHDGRTGRLVGDHAPEAIGRALADLLARTRDRESWWPATVRAVEPYRPEIVLQPFFDAHREIAARRQAWS